MSYDNENQPPDDGREERTRALERHALQLAAKLVMNEIPKVKELLGRGFLKSLPESFIKAKFDRDDDGNIIIFKDKNSMAGSIVAIPALVEENHGTYTTGTIEWEIGHDVITPGDGGQPNDCDWEAIFEKVPTFHVATLLPLMLLRDEIFNAFFAADSADVAADINEMARDTALERKMRRE